MWKTVYLAFIFIVLVGCAAGGDSSPAADAAQTVEQYLQAKVEGNRERIQQLLCAEMEGVLERESQTFVGVQGVQLEGMACAVAEEGVVRCEGKITALYGTEQAEFPLTAYRVVEEDGEWKWCGETN